MIHSRPRTSLNRDLCQDMPCHAMIKMQSICVPKWSAKSLILKSSLCWIWDRCQWSSCSSDRVAAIFFRPSRTWSKVRRKTRDSMDQCLSCHPVDFGIPIWGKDSSHCSRFWKSTTMIPSPGRSNNGLNGLMRTGYVHFIDIKEL